MGMGRCEEGDDSRKGKHVLSGTIGEAEGEVMACC